jgi:hypothetical protein
VKIKKNLSDADMLRGWSEEESFETAVLTDDSEHRRIRRTSRELKKEAEAKMMLPPEAQEKLNRCLLEVSMEWLREKGGDVDWKVVRDGMVITLVPAPAKHKK